MRTLSSSFSPWVSVLSNSTFSLTVPISNTTFEFATLIFVCCLLVLSLVSFIFIVCLCIRCRRLTHLKKFNSLWSVRLLLVFFASMWCLNEIPILPFIPKKYVPYPWALCKTHVVLSLGLFEPGFLVTLLFLLNVSVKKQSPSGFWAFVIVWPICLPVLALQSIFVFHPPFTAHVPNYMYSSDVVLGNNVVACSYPLYSGILFGGFVLAYSLAFLFSCWRVMAFVINKKIQVRVNLLATSFVIALPLQMLCLVFLPIWSSDVDLLHHVAELVMFLAVAWCVAVGEVTLVIKPIAEAFAAGRASCRTLGRPEGGGGAVEEQL